MTEYEQQLLRLECLRMALGVASAVLAKDANPGDTVARAQRYYDFVTGASSKSPREQIEAALDAANVR